MENINVKEVRKPFSMAVWARIILLLISFFVMMMLLGTLSYLLSSALRDSFADKESWILLDSFLGTLSTLISVLIVTGLFKRFIDRESFCSLGFSSPGISFDALFALLLILTIYGIGTAAIVLTGEASIRFIALNIPVLLFLIVKYAVVAFGEEILFRGYILGNLLRKVNKFWALTISSVLFGLMHLLNPSVSILPVLNIILAGYLLGVSYIYTRNLWFPIFLHLFWNYLQGPVLGYHVSGTVEASVFSMDFRSPSMMNGGSFGFEGSIVCSVLCFTAIFIANRVYRKSARNIHAEAEVTI